MATNKKVGVEIGYTSKGAKEAAADARNLGNAVEDFAKKLKRADFNAVSDLEKKLRSANFGNSANGLKQTADALNSVQNGFKLTSQQATQLSFQLNDVFTGLVSGQKPFMILAQQGPQITQIFGGITATLARFGPTLAGLGATIGPALAAISAAKIGQGAAKSITELSIAARGTGLSVQQLDKYVAALAGRGVDVGDVTSGFESLRKSAFDSRDAWQKAYEALIKARQIDPTAKLAKPDDVLTKLGVDTRNFVGNTEALLKQLQTAYAKLPEGIEKQDFARIVEDKYGRPIAELVAKTPGQVSQLNAALSAIVPPLSAGQIDQAQRIEIDAGRIAKVYENLGQQASAAFLPAAEAFTRFKLSLVDTPEKVGAILGVLREVSATAADFFRILSGSENAKQSSPIVATYIQTFKSLYDAIILVKDAVSGIGDILTGAFDLATSKIERDVLYLERVWLNFRKLMGGMFGDTFNKDLEGNWKAIGENAKQIAEASAKFWGENKKGATEAKKEVSLFGNEVGDIQNKASASGLNNTYDQAASSTDNLAASLARASLAHDTLNQKAKTLNDIKQSPGSLDAERAAIAEQQRLEANAEGDRLRAKFLADGGKLDALGANDQVAVFQQLGPVATQLEASSSRIGTSWDAIKSAASATNEAISSIQPPDFSRLLSQLAQASQYAEQIAKSASSTSSGGGSKDSSSPFPFASGGFVSGAGTATSDSIPAWLSNGEYVVRASRVKSLGVGFLNAINGTASIPSVLGRRRFADGGLVGAAPSGGVGGQPVHLHFDGQSIGPLRGSPDVIDQLERANMKRRLSSTTTRAPSRIG